MELFKAFSLHVNFSCNNSSSLILHLYAVKGLTQVYQKLLDAPNHTLVPLDLSLPPVSSGIFHKFLF